MNCPRCDMTLIRANNGSDWFCRKCWLDVDEPLEPANHTAARSDVSCANHKPVPCEGGTLCLSCRVFIPAVGRALKPSYREPDKLPPVSAKTPVCGTGASAALSSRGSVQSIIFELPLPLAKCSPNARYSGHWSAGAKARRDYKAECLACISRVDYMFGRMFPAATISTEWFLGPSPGRYHPKDAGNAISSCKQAVDAIVEAGYLPDDSAKYLHWGNTILYSRKESAGRACIVVTLTRKTTEAR